MAYSDDIDYMPTFGLVEIAVGVTLSIIVLVAGIMIMNVAFENRREAIDQNAPAPPQPSFEVPTAREAYPAAVALIRDEDPGAQLASAAGGWYPGVHPVYIESGRTGWTYFFFLPATNQMAEVVVDQGNIARLVTTVDWETPPDLLDDRLWNADSALAMPLFLSICQEEMTGDSSVVARLSAARENTYLNWHIELFDADNDSVCKVDVDAASGSLR